MLLEKFFNVASLLFFGQHYEGQAYCFDKVTLHLSILFRIKDICFPIMLGDNCLLSSPLGFCHFLLFVSISTLKITIILIFASIKDRKQFLGRLQKMGVVSR